MRDLRSFTWGSFPQGREIGASTIRVGFKVSSSFFLRYRSPQKR